MCCLRYEHEVYEEALKTIPPVGSLVKTPNGTGTVMETRPLEQTVRVRYEDKGESPKTFAVSEIQVLRHGKGGKRTDGADAPDEKEENGKENA
jgi:cell fate regulator YaaT (PSP1 superfamily)